MVLLPAGPRVAEGCGWDYDTLQMEARRFPGALAMFTGRFLRHSKAFYEWRVRDRRDRIGRNPSDLAAHDDLGVALDKLGRHEEAIATMDAKERIKAGLYETFANRGTFHFHAGLGDATHFAAGVADIERALKINPNAHFGREWVQLALARFLRDAARAAPLTMPLPRRIPLPSGGFASLQNSFWPEVEMGEARAPSRQAVATVLQGVYGMMFFGKPDSPVLYDVAARLLESRDVGAKSGSNLEQRLIAFAYLRAARFSAASAAMEYRKRAIEWMNRGPMQQYDDRSERIIIEFNREVTKADRWLARVHTEEARLLARGGDVDAAFWRRFGKEHPPVKP